MEPTNETPEPKSDEPEFEDLLKFLEEQIPDLDGLLGGLFSGAQRDVEKHDAQMELVADHLRAAMLDADQEQSASDSSEAEPLAWGLWRSQCGCLHLSVPDGKGGWATNVEDVEPEKLLEVINGMVRGLGEAGLTMLRALAEAHEAP